ncbi:hypothetical protein N2152v2_004751 [Parachlorella kessleri]
MLAQLPYSFSDTGSGFVARRPATSLSTGFPAPTSYAADGVYSFWRSEGQRGPLLVDPPAPAVTPKKQGTSLEQKFSRQGQVRLEGSCSGSSNAPQSAPSGPEALPAEQLESYLQLLKVKQLQGHLAQPQAGGEPSSAQSAPVRPVFRAAPYAAELARQRQLKDTVRILFLDEGNSCRAVLAVAVMQYMLCRLRKPLDVTVESASLGWAAPGPHDPRVASIAREMALPLQPRTAREFDELEDMVQYDLVLAMDTFDLQDVLREVAVMERINPQGLYSTRVARLGTFGAASLRVIPGQLADDIPDPLYGAMGGAAELAALRAAVHRIAFACRGLVHSLVQLRARSPPSMGLRRALAVSRQCPLLCPGVMRSRERLAERWRPVWQQGGDLYTIRWTGQQRQVVRHHTTLRCSNGKAWGYWQDPANVEEELRHWMAQAGQQDRLPTQQQLRASGANTLAASIANLGGLAAYSRRMGLPMAARHPNGYWNDFANLAAELAPFMESAGISQRAVGDSAEGRLGGSGACLAVQQGGMRETRAPAGSSAAPAATLLGTGTMRRRSGRGTAAGASPTAPPPPRQLVFPKQQQLAAAGRFDLLYAIRLHGGRAEVARRLGARLSRDPPRSVDQICTQLRAFMSQQQQREGQGQEEAAPPGSRLDQQDKPEENWGAEATWEGSAATQAPVDPCPAPQQTVACPGSVRMPSKSELYRAGRADLAIAVKRFGGHHYFAQLLGLNRGGSSAVSRSTAAKSGVAAIEDGAAVGLHEYGAHGSSSAPSPGAETGSTQQPGQRHIGVLPQRQGPTDRAATAGHVASLPRVAQPGSTGRRGRLRGRPAVASASPAAAAITVAAPTFAALSLGQGEGAVDSAGRQQPSGASLGGTQLYKCSSTEASPPLAPSEPTADLSPWTAVARTAPPAGAAAAPTAVTSSSCAPPPMLVNVGAALLDFMQVAGLLGSSTLPSRQQLIDAGRRDLANAVQRCGGGRRLAEHLGLEFEEQRGRKPKHARDVASRLQPRPESALLDNDFVLV